MEGEETEGDRGRYREREGERRREKEIEAERGREGEREVWRGREIFRYSPDAIRYRIRFSRVNTGSMMLDSLNVRVRIEFACRTRFAVRSQRRENARRTEGRGPGRGGGYIDYWKFRKARHRRSLERVICV